MKKLCVYILLFLCVGSFDVYAASRSFLLQQCRERMKQNPPQVEVVYNYGDLNINRSKNYKEIEQLYKNIYGKTNKGNRISGLTVFNNYEDIGVAVQYENISTQHRCFYPKKIILKIGFKDTIMYLDSAMEEESCLYKRVLRHEQMHVDLAHTSLGLYALALRARIEDIISDVGPKVSSDELEAVAKKLSLDYQNRISVLSGLFKATMMQQQLKLDSEENYNREEVLCR